MPTFISSQTDSPPELGSRPRPCDCRKPSVTADFLLFGRNFNNKWYQKCGHILYNWQRVEYMLSGVPRFKRSECINQGQILHFSSSMQNSNAEFKCIFRVAAVVDSAERSQRVQPKYAPESSSSSAPKVRSYIIR